MAENEGVIRQQLGFDASQAIDELKNLNSALTTLGSQLGGIGSQLSAFNASANQTVASLKQMSTAAATTLSSMSKLASAPAGNLDAMLGVGKVTEGMKEMQEAARLGTSVYGGAMSSMASQTRTASSAVAEASKKTQEWVVSWNTLSRVVMTQFIVRGLSQIRDAFREAYDSAMDFTKRVSEIHAILPERNFAQIADEVRQLSDAFNQPLSRVVEAEYQTISDQFVATKDRLNILTAANALAKVGADDLAASAQLLTGALNAYGESSEMAGLRAAQFFESVNLGRFRMAELGTAMGRVQTIGHEMGVSMEELQASLIAITIGGVKANEAATQLRGILSALMKPSEAMKAALREIGAESGEAAIKTWGFHGALEKLQGTTNGAADAMAKLFPNVRADAGALRLLAEGAKSYEQAMERLHAIDMSTLQKKLRDFMDTDAEKLTKELNKLANFFTAEFGLKLISTLNTLIRLIGGGDGLVGAFRLLTSTLPTDIALIGGLALAFAGTAKLAAAAKMTYVDAFGSIITKAPQAAKAISGLQLAFAALAGVEIARMIGQNIGEAIVQWGEAPVKAVQQQMEMQIKMREAQTAAEIREEQRKVKELFQILRQHFAEANKLYLKDVENYKAAMKVEVENVKNAFDKIMSMRQHLTQQLAAAEEASAKKIIENQQEVGEIRERIADRTFNTETQMRNLSPDWQFRMYEQRMKQIADQAAKLQATAKDADQQKLADQEWRRAEAYAQMTEQAARQSGSLFLQRQAAQDLNDLDNKRIAALNKQTQAEKQFNAEVASTKQQAEQTNAQLERERDLIEETLSPFKKGETGDVTRKGDTEFMADLARAKAMIDDWVNKVKSSTQGEFLKKFLGDADSLKQLKRDAERLLSSIYLKELQAAPEAMLKLRAQLQEGLDKAGFTVPVMATLENVTGKDMLTSTFDEIISAAEKKFTEMFSRIKSRASELTTQAQLRGDYGTQRKTLDETLAPVGYDRHTFSGMIAGENMDTARAKIKAVADMMDKLANSSKITDEQILEVKKALQGLDASGAADHAFGNLDKDLPRMQAAMGAMADIIKRMKESQEKTPEAVPEKERQEAEAIRQTIESIQQKKGAQNEAASQMEREKAAAEGGKAAIDGQFNSVNAGITSIGNLEQAWWGVEAAAAAAAQAAAAASMAGGGGEEFDFSGAETTLVALGGLIRHFDVGGFVPRGTDTVPAMLSPGEFVMNRGATQRWFSHLVAMNAGIAPAYRTQGGRIANVTIGDINVNGSGQPRETAREVLKSIKRELRRGTSVL